MLASRSALSHTAPSHPDRCTNTAPCWNHTEPPQRVLKENTAGQTAADRESYLDTQVTHRMMGRSVTVALQQHITGVVCLTVRSRAVGSSPDDLPAFSINTPTLLTLPTALHWSKTHTQLLTTEMEADIHKCAADTHLNLPSSAH